MFRYSNSVILAAILLLASCKEKGPIISPDDGQAKIGDTTYLLETVPAADTKNVLFEEFTGVKCANCPQARRLIEGIAKNYPDRVHVIAYHFKNSGFTIPYTGTSNYDFRTDDATNMVNFLSVTGDDWGLPTGSVSRLFFKSGLLNGRENWGIMTDEVLKGKPTANISISSTYDADKSEAIIKVKLTYLEETKGKQAMTVAITESNMIDIQLESGFIDTFYRHDHVLRKIITLHSGDPVLNDIETKEPGRVYEKTLIAKVDAAWKPENCHIVAFAHNNNVDNKEILQVAEVTLK